VSKQVSLDIYFRCQSHEDVSMVACGREQVRLQCPLEALSDRSGDRSASGRQFHVAGPLTAKLRCPVAVRASGTSRVPVTAEEEGEY